MSIELGETIPALTTHATSVSLPTWNSNIGYEEGQEWVMDKLKTGYPRFFIHKLIAAFAQDIVAKFGHDGQQAMLFPSRRAAQGCVNFMHLKDPLLGPSHLQVISLVLDSTQPESVSLLHLRPTISAVLFPTAAFPLAKQYWQHSGDGISSRRGEFSHRLFQEGLLIKQEDGETPLVDFAKPCKGPKRYQRGSKDKTTLKSHQSASRSGEAANLSPINGEFEAHESSQFLEERFGRNLDVSLVDNARSMIRRRIAGSLMGESDAVEPNSELTSDTRGVIGLHDDDVYLYSCGMNSIFQTHQMLLGARTPLKSISFGFPYVDTLKILEKFGPGCLFYGNGSSEDLDDLESRLKGGERFLALFCEFPGNPMLLCPDLQRIRKLADEFDFAVVVDETIGNFINVHVLPHADVVVSSLTKIFSGECNVMGGSAILNPRGRYYNSLKKAAHLDYEENYWAEDVIFMERNSRHFVSRIERINRNAEIICDILRSHPLVKTVYYPKFNSSRSCYDACRTTNGGYGGLLSFIFHHTRHAVAFHDRIETAKGPSLGTNFTIVSPYVILAHYLELDWASQFGVPTDLIRVSVGLEDEDDLVSRFNVALKAAEEIVL